tara:strand:- start:2593 stop:3006 length:414 start_codon:yes stop_codon:yes gene_type:complete
LLVFDIKLGAWDFVEVGIRELELCRILGANATIDYFTYPPNDDGDFADGVFRRESASIPGPVFAKTKTQTYSSPTFVGLVGAICLLVYLAAKRASGQDLNARLDTLLKQNIKGVILNKAPGTICVKRQLRMVKQSRV